MIATTLNYNHEVRSATKAFAEIRDITINDEMIELAGHIIKTKRGRFDPSTFDDRYDAALKEIVQAKIEGRKIEPLPLPKESNVIDLMTALRESAKRDKGKKQPKKRTASGKTASG